MRILLPLLLAASLGACATTEDIVPVPYAASAAAPVAGAAQVKVTVQATDARTSNRGRISSKINGYGMEMAAIRAKEDVADTVREAIGAELKSRGYTEAPGGAKISAAVETFYADFKTGVLAGKAKGDVALTVTVSDADGGERYRRRISGAAEKSVQMASGKNAADAIGRALGDALRTLFGDAAFLNALR